MALVLPRAASDFSDRSAAVPCDLTPGAALPCAVTGPSSGSPSPSLPKLRVGGRGHSLPVSLACNPPRETPQPIPLLSSDQSTRRASQGNCAGRSVNDIDAVDNAFSTNVNISRHAVACHANVAVGAAQPNGVRAMSKKSAPPKGPHRSAISGRYVTTRTAVRSPKTTVSEPRR